MLLSFSQEILDDTRLLPSLSVQVLTEFCKVALEMIRDGALSKAKLNKVAESLSVPVDSVSRALHSLSLILIDASKRSISDADFTASLDDLKLSSEQSSILTSTYTTHMKEIRHFLSELSMRLPHYQSLDWRLDVQLATRALRNQAKPTFLLELETRTEDQVPSRSLLECDYGTLCHLVDELESAVKEANTTHTRRMMRYVK